MATKQENQRILLTKRLLQEGLLRLLETKDLDKISVTELCREAGINRATFYNHYASPLALLMDLEEKISQKLQELAAYPTTLEEVVDQMEQICIYLKENVRIFTILSRCHADDELAYTFQSINRYPICTRNPAMDSDSIHLVSTYLYTGCYYMIREWLLQDIDKTPREIAELAASIINREYL